MVIVLLHFHYLFTDQNCVQMENEITTFTKWKNYWQVRPLSKCEQFMIIYNTLLFLLNQNIFSSIFSSSSFCPPLIYLPCLCNLLLNRLKLVPSVAEIFTKMFFCTHVNFEDLNNNFSQLLYLHCKYFSLDECI